MSFAAELRAAAADVWEAQHAHPFVRGVGDGTLDEEARDELQQNATVVWFWVIFTSVVILVSLALAQVAVNATTGRVNDAAGEGPARGLDDVVREERPEVEVDGRLGCGQSNVGIGGEVQ